MLRQAVESQLPIIAVRSRDAMHLPDVLEELSGKKPKEFTEKTKIEVGGLYYRIVGKQEKAVFPPSLYKQFVASEGSLVVVNPTVMEDFFFDAGEAPVPKKMMRVALMDITEDQQKTDELMLALGGCTLKEMAEFARLTMARDGGLTGNGVVATRKQSFADSTGLYFVDTHQELYVPDPALMAYAKREKPFFLGDVDPRLVPRGILADGPPGTGKSAGAKFLAELWGVPLYRMDIASTKSKWVGQSQQNLQGNLERLDREEPCVVLIDEVEKSMSRGRSEGDAGTSTDMLSQLLWWLAEHKTKVFAYMTTNDAGKLPPELVREGRIDQHFVFPGLDPQAAGPFVCTVLDTFKDADYDADDVAWIVKQAMVGAPLVDNRPMAAQAALTACAIRWLKLPDADQETDPGAPQEA